MGSERPHGVVHAVGDRVGLPIGPGSVICLAEQILRLTESVKPIPTWNIHAAQPKGSTTGGSIPNAVERLLSRWQ